jgi:hypothetical protein
MKQKTKEIIQIIIMLPLLWVGISTFIQALKCPEMSQTELLLHVPKSFICDWTK